MISLFAGGGLEHARVSSHRLVGDGRRDAGAGVGDGFVNSRLRDGGQRCALQDKNLEF